MQKIKLILIPFLLFSIQIFAQADRWQQHVDYKMDIDFDDKVHRLVGQQTLIYSNNSPDALKKVFYHLYFNAFQPNSAMDVRSRTIADPDSRVRDRIFNLSESEQGYQKIKSLKCNGKSVNFKVEGTILEVTLNEPIKAKSSAKFEMEFEAQVPLQIRRSGRFNKEGVDYSMAQWYPKMCEYDEQGWHSNPYVAREFYGIWGDYEVKIKIDKKFVLGGTGYLMNPNEVGCGYETNDKSLKRPNTDKLTWHFKSPNVHDFMWAADPDYQHTQLKVDDSLTLHFLYLKNTNTKGEWDVLPKIMKRSFEIANQKYGRYPYKQYSFVQGGDGGMEYPMATLIKDGGFGTAIHESMHSWYQCVLASNESLYPWMDEGFTDHATDVIIDQINKEGNILPSKLPERSNIFEEKYKAYFNLVEKEMNEPLSTHADHYITNRGYGIASYVEGGMFLNQLEYIIGKKDFDSGMLRYFNTWKFKHPNANDFIRIMEYESGLELDWYKEYWINQTHTIDYGIKNVESDAKNTKITLERIGKMIMPLDVLVTYDNGEKAMWNIPLDLMRGEKENENAAQKYTVAPDWQWVNPTYQLNIINSNDKKIVKVEIDPSQRLADVDKKNNTFEVK